MTVRTCSINALAAIRPPCGGCRVTVTCPRAADDLLEQGVEGGGTGDVIQKRFVRGSATTVAYLVDKAPNMALRSHRQRCVCVIDYTGGLTRLFGRLISYSHIEEFYRRSPNLRSDGGASS